LTNKSAYVLLPDNRKEVFSLMMGPSIVSLEDIKRTIILCLRHRCRRDPMESINSGDKVNGVFEQVFLGVDI